ncbi:hypothetical protein TSUD_341580 [Trifolium subterraneum]|uniref:Uncharacterized protein n=1 Tax=Trifolium subterraneum TaxID=3900 RepID=A0A2Z6P291_TRISU|nr:hypothetical protein TSUD_341580 [Trifolium subterraneum]
MTVSRIVIGATARKDRAKAALRTSMETMRTEAKVAADAFGFVEHIVFKRTEIYSTKKTYFDQRKVNVNLVQKVRGTFLPTMTVSRIVIGATARKDRAKAALRTSMETMRTEAKVAADAFGFVEQIVFKRTEIYSAKKTYFDQRKVNVNLVQKVYVVKSILQKSHEANCTTVKKRTCCMKCFILL